MEDLQADLKARWVPTPEQVNGANALLLEDVIATGDPVFNGSVADEIWTAHVLVNKVFGFWTADVRLVPVDGWFLTLNGASEAAQAATVKARAEHGVLCTGGYTRHTLDGFAVFEDIMTAAGRDL